MDEIKRIKDKSKKLIKIINEWKGVKEILEDDLRGKILDGTANIHIKDNGQVYQIIIQRKPDDSYLKHNKKFYKPNNL